MKRSKSLTHEDVILRSSEDRIGNSVEAALIYPRLPPGRIWHKFLFIVELGRWREGVHAGYMFIKPESLMRCESMPQNICTMF